MGGGGSVNHEIRAEIPHDQSTNRKKKEEMDSQSDRWCKYTIGEPREQKNNHSLGEERERTGTRKLYFTRIVV